MYRAYIETLIADSIAVKQKILSSDEQLEHINKVAEVCVKAYRQGNKLMLAGNGGSAGDAQHIAAELVARFELDRKALPALALTTDTSMLTAIGNDYGYEHLFSRQLQANGVAGDVFIGISTSGNSANILTAVESAKQSGITTVGLCGESGVLSERCDYTLAVPSSCTARIQESHIMIGHILCGIIEMSLFGA